MFAKLTCLMVLALFLHPVAATAASAAAAAPPAWLSLIRPEATALSLSGAFTWQHTDNPWPELWLRSSQEYFDRQWSVGLWQRLPRLRLLGLSDLDQAFTFSVLTAQSTAWTTLYAWSPDGTLISDTAEVEVASHIRLAWQLEQVTALWLRGGEISYTTDGVQPPDFDLALWLARVYEPALLRVGVSRSLSNDATTGEVGCELALNRRLAVGAKVTAQWPAPARGLATVNLQLSATLRGEDKSGWSLAISRMPAGYGVAVERSLVF